MQQNASFPYKKI